MLNFRGVSLNKGTVKQVDEISIIEYTQQDPNHQVLLIPGTKDSQEVFLVWASCWKKYTWGMYRRVEITKTWIAGDCTR